MVEIAESIQLGIDTLNGLDWYFQVLICIATSILAIYCLRRFVLRQIAELVNDTEVGWDNDLYIALESKINIFFVAICVNISLLWVNPNLLGSIFPLLNSLYILLLTMMLTTTVKIATPPLMAMMNSNKKGGVSVTGGNHFVSIIVRIVIWLIGINAILGELNIEVTGLLASFALFSLIIGLSLQHTIGNILNSFMLAMDSPFDVGDRIVTMVNDLSLEVEADIPESKLAGITPGRKVQIRFGKNKIQQASIRAVVPAEDGRTRTRTVRFVPNFNGAESNGILAANQTVTVDIPISKLKEMVTVHKDAVIVSGQSYFVFVIKNQEAWRRDIKIGAASGDRFIVLSGLNPGDIVATHGNEKLKPGKKVKIYER